MGKRTLLVDEELLARARNYLGEHADDDLTLAQYLSAILACEPSGKPDYRRHDYKTLQMSDELVREAERAVQMWREESIQLAAREFGDPLADILDIILDLGEWGSTPVRGPDCEEKPKPMVILIEMDGGLVREVYGLPKGITYAVMDWDMLEIGEGYDFHAWDEDGNLAEVCAEDFGEAAEYARLTGVDPVKIEKKD